MSWTENGTADGSVFNVRLYSATILLARRPARRHADVYRGSPVQY